MPAWCHTLLERFPEYGHRPESWSLIDAGAELGRLLERATAEGDVSSASRVLSFVSWAHSQTPQAETLFHFCADVLSPTVSRESLWPALAASMTEEAFLRLRPVFQYLFKGKSFAALEEDVRLKSRANLSLKSRRSSSAA